MNDAYVKVIFPPVAGRTDLGERKNGPFLLINATDLAKRAQDTFI